MPVYAYKALDPAKSPTQGTISADTPRQARELLRNQGLTVRAIEAHTSAATGKNWFRKLGQGSPKTNQVATAIQVPRFG